MQAQILAHPLLLLDWLYTLVEAIVSLLRMSSKLLDTQLSRLVYVNKV